MITMEAASAHLSGTSHFSKNSEGDTEPFHSIKMISGLYFFSISVVNASLTSSVSHVMTTGSALG